MRKVNGEEGFILLVVVILMLALTITGLAFLNGAVMEHKLAMREVHRNQAFYLADGGIEHLSAKLYAGGHWTIKNKPLQSGGQDGSHQLAVDVTALGEGQYWVEYYDGNPPYDPPYAISIGQVIKGGEVVAEKKIKIKLYTLARSYEHAIHADSNYSPDWTLGLRGTGSLNRDGRYEEGGKDTVEGNIYADADIHLYEEATVYPPPDPNTYELLGEVTSTQNIFKHPNPGFAGYVPYTTEYVDPILSPDLRGMNYAENNTHNVGAIFDEEGVYSGYLKYGHELRNIVMKNPSDRASECSSTPGDDYFFEPSSVTGAGTVYTGVTPLDLGQDRIYYVDGDVWFHNKRTYGFSVTGKVVIVATGNIHISDNIEYADDESLLAVVALGEYDEITGDLISGGNIYFGDPVFGTTYTVDAFMFAANNFLYNVDSTDPGNYQRPETGFNVYGNWVAINEVSIIRDWYDDGEWETRRRWNRTQGRYEYYEEWVSSG